MSLYVVCTIQMEGLHCWPEAPGKVAYLRQLHRHVFVITMEFPVLDSNREIEIITRQSEIQHYLLERYSDDNGMCCFGRMSCEDIAGELLEKFSAASCTVLEDGFGGAKIVR